MPPVNADLAVDDENLAVVAVVRFLNRVPAHRTIVADRHARALQPLDVLVRDVARAERVDDEVDLDAAAAGIGQRAR